MDLKRIREVIELMEEKSLEELEIEDKELKLRLRRGGAGRAVAPVREAVVAAAPAPVVVEAAPGGAQPALAQGGKGAQTEAADAGLVSVNSPIVGTFYRAPDPNSPAFVNVGDRVRVGQVLCIIEAMKLMNEIESEVGGVIVKVEQENGQPVQFGAPLFAIRPD